MNLRLTSGAALKVTNAFNPAIRNVKAPRHRAVSAFMVAVLIAAALTPAAQQQPSRNTLLGFSHAAEKTQREAEGRFISAASTDAISELHRRVTRRPHVAGSAASMEVVETVRKALADAGLETEVHEYTVLLSTPKKIAAEISSPTREALSVTEPPHDMDPDSRHPELGPGYVAYSASGTVSGQVVYVNYGLPSDYARLAAAGIDVTRKIVLARYARSHRAVKIHTAEKAGAAAIIIYSDPSDDGFTRGPVWPDGPWRADFQLQRGNGKYSWFWHGDPLSPGVAATTDAHVISDDEAPTLPRIPAIVLSSKEAAKILSRVQGPAVPAGFQGGLPFTYRLGPGPVTVTLDVQMDQSRRPIRDIIARLNGRDPDRCIMLGTHHDAWSFGGMDPGSGLAATFEVARSLAELKQSGWVPARSIVFAFWDAEEFGLVGSTEYAEQFAKELRERAAVYINTDLSMRGRFDGGGTPSLRDLLVQVARDVPSFTGQGSVYDTWRADEWRKLSAEQRRTAGSSFEVELALLGSGADFVAFQDHLGLPTMQMEFDFEGSYGTYHSNYDTRFFVEKFSDADFVVARTLARVLGLAVMRLANAPVLPFRYSHYGHAISSYLNAAAAWPFDDATGPAVTLDLRKAQRLSDTFTHRARELERRIDAALASGTLSAESARALNDRLMRLEQTLLDESAPADKRWYRHVIYGWNIYSLYEGQPLPGLAEAIRLRDQSRVNEEQMRLVAALNRLLAALDRISVS
jgi:N-acetylated-alpha-linked acidic dipeptidase